MPALCCDLGGEGRREDLLAGEGARGSGGVGCSGNLEEEWSGESSRFVVDLVSVLDPGDGMYEYPQSVFISLKRA